MADLDWGFAENGGEAHEFVDKIIQIKIEQTPLSTLYLLRLNLRLDTSFSFGSGSLQPKPFLVFVLFCVRPFSFGLDMNYLVGFIFPPH